MTRETVFSQELIGKKVIIAESTNPSQVGLSGKIIDETKALLVISDERGNVFRVLKNTVTIKLEGDSHLLRGTSLSKRPEERIKG